MFIIWHISTQVDEVSFNYIIIHYVPHTPWMFMKNASIIPWMTKFHLWNFSIKVTINIVFERGGIIPNMTLMAKCWLIQILSNIKMVIITWYDQFHGPMTNGYRDIWAQNTQITEANIIRRGHLILTCSKMSIIHIYLNIFVLCHNIYY